jgi:hypothetical protein
MPHGATECFRTNICSEGAAYQPAKSRELDFGRYLPAGAKPQMALVEVELGGATTTGLYKMMQVRFRLPSEPTGTIRASFHIQVAATSYGGTTWRGQSLSLRNRVDSRPVLTSCVAVASLLLSQAKDGFLWTNAVALSSSATTLSWDRQARLSASAHSCWRRRDHLSLRATIASTPLRPTCEEFFLANKCTLAGHKHPVLDGMVFSFLFALRTLLRLFGYCPLFLRELHTPRLSLPVSGLSLK